MALAALGCGSTTTPGPDAPTTPPLTNEVDVALRGGDGRVNFAVPLQPGQLQDGTAVEVSIDGAPVPTAARGLATYPDGSLRSVHVQFERAGADSARVTLGRTPAETLAFVPVPDTQDGDGMPVVAADLPARWIANSGVAGPLRHRGDLVDPTLDGWALCDYGAWDTAAFEAGAGNREAWLFDRVTAMVRGIGYDGAQAARDSAQREATIYLAGLQSQGGVAVAIAPPDANDDLKYHYAQGLALTYLLTGDDRMREGAEAIARRAAQLWADPGYAGGSDFWTERHAGFGLLAFEWAARVSDDDAATFDNLAQDAARAYLAMQAAYAAPDDNARCFGHSADAHGESYGYLGCSPWMSAIVADALDAVAERTGGALAADIDASLAKLARALVAYGLDDSGKPYYWQSVDGSAGEVDDFDEHWGESAYVVALGWAREGGTDSALRDAALALVEGVRTRGEVGQVRSFNWQCRSAVMTPALLDR